MGAEESEFYAEPVHDIPAELAVLACMIQSPVAVEAAGEMLDAENFYRGAHQEIFRTMVLMMAAGDQIDPVLLRARMAEDGTLKVLGDGGRGLLLSELAGMPVAHTMVSGYAQVVLKHAVRRAMVQAGVQLIQHGRAGDLDEAAAVERGHVLLDQVLGGGSRPLDMPGMTADEFCDAPDINAEPLVPGLLNQMERVIVVGPPGSGKSILGLQMAFTTGAGVHPFQHQVTGNRPVTSCVLDLENPPDIVQRRFRTFRSIAMNYPGWNGKNIRLVHKPGGLNLTASRDAYGLAQFIKRNGIQLVIAGPIYKMLAGVKVDLDTYAQVAAFWDRMREDFGITLWLEAHAPFGAGGRNREMRPEGSNLWEKWPEFGFGLKWATKAHGGRQGLEWTDFRGRREEGRPWPSWITRNRLPGRGWPWIAQYEKTVFQRLLIPDGEEE